METDKKPHSSYQQFQELFRFLIVIFNTNNYVPLDELAEYTAEFSKTKYDITEPLSHQRFIASLKIALLPYSYNKTSLTEHEFCLMMRDAQKDSMLEKGMQSILEKSYKSVKPDKRKEITIPEFHKLLNKSGLKLTDEEFNQIMDQYFVKGKESLTEEEFILFATGKFLPLNKIKSVKT